jgi:hypothetical protein
MKEPTTVTMTSRDHDAFIEAAFSRALLVCLQREGHAARHRIPTLPHRAHPFTSHAFWHGVTTMKSRTPLIALVTAGSLMLAGTVLAQDQTMPTPPPPPSGQTMPAQPTPPPPTQIMPATQPTPPPPPGGTQAQTATAGQQVTINSSVPPVNAGPAPSFEQLANGKKYISESDASAYPLLANDWAYVDKGHAGRVSKAQYEAWLSNNR